MFDELCKVLNQNGFKTSCFETGAEAAAYLEEQIQNTSVGFGGSVTLEEIGLYDILSKKNEVFWHQRTPQGKSSDAVRVEANAAEVYVSSVNGIAETGEIINIDNNCNRVAAIFYGHRKVYLIAGKNKIESTYDRALDRARNIAAPLNAQRLHRNTPCALKADRCYNCASPERICRGLSVLWKTPATGEFEVILVNEKLGY